ncbi:MAG: phenylalanine--tRNA ligase beta subunit-related protein [Micromonosporaceae bacterium]
MPQYRCASESLLRRFRKEGALPQLHPLVDVCNAVSLAFAIPVAVFDVSKITGHLSILALAVAINLSVQLGTWAARNPGVFTRFDNCLIKSGNRAEVSQCIAHLANDIRP